MTIEVPSETAPDKLVLFIGGILGPSGIARFDPDDDVDISGMSPEFVSPVFVEGVRLSDFGFIIALSTVVLGAIDLDSDTTPLEFGRLPIHTPVLFGVAGSSITDDTGTLRVIGTDPVVVFDGLAADTPSRREMLDTIIKNM